ncbi:DUF2178 domain-containing protein [Aquisalibacillus elongatus]|uniref:Uncharacterized protein n=1 Tax=Aquisalibacillus elongatus TaxID=485577 RepID=A0A3N5B831_9BACI|nr:DUF2178 domain-containing protein [Aquisalibacillus elongatus]RPF53477.1 hypothetical protein EDC24_1979 [Aquisalibacillus elongatus]
MNNDQMLNSIFHPLKTWADAEPGNWNMLIGIGFVLLLVGLILTFSFYKKIGKPDERVSQIHLRSASIILFVVIMSDIIFPKEYMWQIFFLFKYSLAFIVSGIYLAVRYKMDFSN